MAYVDIWYAKKMILGVYPGPTWERKVNRMSDNQILAVYYNFLESGKFENPQKQKVYVKELQPEPEFVPQQLTFNDITDWR